MYAETFKKIVHGVGQTILAIGTVGAPMTTHAIRTGSKISDIETWQGAQADFGINVACLTPAFVYMISMSGEPVDPIGATSIFAGMKFLTGLGGTGLLKYLEGEYQKGLSGS